MISTVYIAKNVYGGDGLGRLGDGRVVFVTGAWAGEQVRAEIVEEKRHFVKARLVEVVEASADRRAGESAVPGMVYANLTPEGEVRTKAAQLQEFFERARLVEPGQFNFTNGTPETATPLNYRNKVVYHFAQQKGMWMLGYRAEPSHEIVSVESDPLAVPAINAKFGEIRQAVMTLLTTGPSAVRRDVAQKGNVTVRWTPKTGVKWWVGEAPKDLVLKETTCGRDFEVPADGFYQVNPQVGESLVKSVVSACGGGQSVLDLYCGVGVFGLCCQPAKLVGIESGTQAIESARRNAAAQGQGAAKFFAEQVGRNLRRIPVHADTTIIVDPPRGGMEPNVPAWLAGSKAARIFYVSCDPATLTRDLRTICRGYAIKDIRWFNMFPRTARFETLVTLEKRA